MSLPLFKVCSLNPLVLLSGLRWAIPALIVFIFYHFFDVTYGYWAVVTVAAVMQATFAATFKKSVARLVGTLIGVVLAFVAAKLIHVFPAALYPVFFAGMYLVSLIIFSRQAWAYAGAVSGISFIFIMAMFNVNPNQLVPVIFYRSVDIAVGSLVACVIFYGLFPKKNSVPMVVKAPSAAQWNFKAAFIMSLAALLSLVPWFVWHYAGGFWAPIACLFIVEENISNTHSKAWARFFAHVVVMVIALSVSLLCTTIYGIAVALVIGMFGFGCWYQKPLWGFNANLANTMATAYSVILLVDPGKIGVYATMWARLWNNSLGILCGIFVVNLIQRALSIQVKKV